MFSNAFCAQIIDNSVLQLQEMFLTKAASDIYCENVEEQERIKMMVDLAQVSKINFVLQICNSNHISGNINNLKKLRYCIH